MEIKYHNQAVKHIKALDKPTKQRIKVGIEKLPLGDIKKLKGFSQTFRLRIGDYRVLFDLDGDIIVVKAILPRGEVYKNL